IETLLVPVGRTVPVGTALAVIRGIGVQGAPAAVPLTVPIVAAAPTRAAPAVAAPPPRIPSPTLIPPSGLKISPAARQFAAEKGVDFGAVQGSGPEGAIVFVDVENAWRRLQEAPPKAAPAAVKAPPKPIDLAAMRSAIAAAMARAKREIPHYYVQHTADLGPATEWLAKNNAVRPPEGRLVLGALLVKAVALAVHALPEFNG